MGRGCCAAAQESEAERGHAANLRRVGRGQGGGDAADVDRARVDAGARPPEAPHNPAGNHPPLSTPYSRIQSPQLEHREIKGGVLMQSAMGCLSGMGRKRLIRGL